MPNVRIASQSGTNGYRTVHLAYIPHQGATVSHISAKFASFAREHARGFGGKARRVSGVGYSSGQYTAVYVITY
jgi:hypothetical protein